MNLAKELEIKKITKKIYNMVLDYNNDCGMVGIHECLEEAIPQETNLSEQDAQKLAGSIAAYVATNHTKNLKMFITKLVRNLIEHTLLFGKN